MREHHALVIICSILLLLTFSKLNALETAPYWNVQCDGNTTSLSCPLSSFNSCFTDPKLVCCGCIPDTTTCYACKSLQDCAERACMTTPPGKSPQKRPAAVSRLIGAFFVLHYLQALVFSTFSDSNTFCLSLAGSTHHGSNFYPAYVDFWFLTSLKLFFAEMSVVVLSYRPKTSFILLY